jgi:hypothetical protein
MFEQPVRVLESGMKFLFLHGSEQSGAEDLQHFPVLEVFASELQLGSRHVALLLISP